MYSELKIEIFFFIVGSTTFANELLTDQIDVFVSAEIILHYMPSKTIICFRVYKI